VPTSPNRVGYVRWIVCGLLFLASTINYIDRQVTSILKPTLQREFGWSELDYGDIVFAFQLAYAIGFVVAGRLIDWLGPKRGYTVAIVLWSIAAIGHAEAPLVGDAAAPMLGAIGLGYSTSVAGFIAMRFFLGLGESGNFPAAIRTVAEWFPRKERAFATGLFNSGTNVGAVVAPILVPWITVAYGWYWAFVVTGVVGFLWVIAWLVFYQSPERHPKVSAGELALIRSDPPEPVVTIAWRKLVPHRQAWAFAAGKFMTDPIWWLFLFWIPDFLSRTYGLNLTSLGAPLVVIYLVADVGSIGGGWLSSHLLAKGWSVNSARKTTMFLMALCVVPVMFVSNVQSLWGAVAIISLATAAHQGWSANLFTLTSDMFPRAAVGSVVGFGGMWGAIGGMGIAKVTAYVLQTTGSYVPVFLMAGGTYLVALGVIHLLAPRLEPAKLD
jgi:ACS family hexuronate transporter-like MFS transporter